MNLTINGNDYELNFGLKFCREISKGRSKTQMVLILDWGLKMLQLLYIQAMF